VDRNIENLARRFNEAGKIDSLFDDVSWTHRMLRIRKDFPDAPVLFAKEGKLPQGL